MEMKTQSTHAVLAVLADSRALARALQRLETEETAYAKPLQTLPKLYQSHLEYRSPPGPAVRREDIFDCEDTLP